MQERTLAEASTAPGQTEPLPAAAPTSTSGQAPLPSRSFGRGLLSRLGLVGEPASGGMDAKACPLTILLFLILRRGPRPELNGCLIMAVGLESWNPDQTSRNQTLQMRITRKLNRSWET